MSREANSSLGSTPQLLLTTKIIAIALISGLIFAAAIIYFLVDPNVRSTIASADPTVEPPTTRPVASNPPIVSGVALAALVIWPALGWLMANQVAQTFITRNAKSFPTDPAERRLKLSGVWFTVLLLQYAFIEGAGFFPLIAYFIEGQTWTLIGPVLAAALMLAMFPTEERLRGWLANAEEKIAQAKRNTLA